MKLLFHLQNLKKRFSLYRPTIEVKISQGALLHNLQEYQHTYPSQHFAPVLKSNAYGHGLVTVAKIMDIQDLPFLVVDSLYEARILRGAGIKSKILVMGFTLPENIAGLHHNNVSLAITSLEQLQQVVHTATRKTFIHIKIDTGMRRQGLLPEEIPAALQALTHNRHLVVEGMCSHFANAHTENRAASEAQLTAWEHVLQQIKNAHPQIKYFYIANSAGAYFTKHATSNVVRLGIGLYGFNASPYTQLNLQPALQIETVVSGVKMLRAGDTVGYNSSFIAPRDMKIATIPVGYFEAIDRRLSNQGVVQIHTVDCPIVGVVSMNITSIDVSHVPQVKLGDKVVVVSNNPAHKNSEEQISSLINEIPYVVLSRIPEHLRRNIVA